MIKIDGVTKKFGSVTAVNNLSLTVESGSVFGLVGSNGSGKSTLLRMISGVIFPQSGAIYIDDEKVFENFSAKAKCFFVSDFPFFYSDSTLESLSKLYRGVYPNWSDGVYLNLCSMFPIKRKAKIISMSKGMQRQAALILALSTQPQYLMLDEVFDGLDPVGRQLLKKLLMQAVSERNMTVIIASHNLRELEDICDHVGFLHKGGIVLEEELDSLKLGIHKIQAAFAKPLPDNAFDKLNIIKKDKVGSICRFVAKGNYDEIMNEISLLSPIFAEALPLTLEEVFIREMEAAGYDIDNIL